VLWVKVDPARQWIRRVLMRKPDYCWVEQLYSDGRVEAQLDALWGLAELPLAPPGGTAVVSSGVPPLAVRALGECLRGRVAHTQEEHSLAVRAAAAEALAAWQNAHAPATALNSSGSSSSSSGSGKDRRGSSSSATSSGASSAAAAGASYDLSQWHGLSQLLRFFSERFLHPSFTPDLSVTPAPGDPPRGPLNPGAAMGALFPLPPGALLPNWFDDETEYALKKAAVWAVACVRARDGTVPPAVTALLTALLRDCDSSESPGVCDDYYVAALLVAAGQSAAAVPAATVAAPLLAKLGSRVSATAAAAVESERAGVERLAREARAWLEADKLRGSHNGVVAACALQVCVCMFVYV
jgi:hypothetical protein